MEDPILFNSKPGVSQQLASLIRFKPSFLVDRISALLRPFVSIVLFASRDYWSSWDQKKYTCSCSLPFLFGGIFIYHFPPSSLWKSENVWKAQKYWSWLDIVLNIDHGAGQISSILLVCFLFCKMVIIFLLFRILFDVINKQVSLHKDSDQSI